MKMRKIIAVIAAALMLFSILPVAAFAADNVADLNTLAINTSYTTRTTTNRWVATNAATQKSAMTSQNVAVILNGKKTAKGTLTSPTLSDGISELSFGYGYSYSESKGVNATINIKDTAGNIVATNNLVESSITQNKAYSYNWVLPTAVTGDFVIEILNNGPSNSTSNKDRLSIWNVTWVSAASEPEAPSTCEHEWELISTTTATCTAAGEEHYECSGCGESKTETIDALGHSYGEPVETVAPNCVDAGEQESTCANCGDVKTETVNALGHNYVDGACDVCGEAQPLEVTIDTFANTGVLDGSTSISWTNGDFSVVNKKGSSSTAIRTSDTDHFRAYVGNTFTVSGGAMAQVVINCTESKYLFSATANTVNDGWTVTTNGTTVIYTATNGSADKLTITIGAQSRVKSVVITPYVEAPSDCEHDYVGVETQAPTCSAEGVMTYTCSKCQESYAEAIAVIPHSYVEDIIDATCTTTGTKTYECSVCFDSYDETIPMKAHTYVDDVCSACGAVKAYEGTLIFDADKENRTEYSAQIQVWESEGVKLTNNRLSSNNVGDYGAPARFYKDSQVIIEFPEMGKLIIDANDIKADYQWAATLDAAELTYTEADGIYTITFDEAVNSIELTPANQVRANSITAIAAHECVWADATCTAPKTCTKCGATEGEALGHTYDNEYDVDCDICGETRKVEYAVIGGETSAMEMENGLGGLAAKFNAQVNGLVVAAGTTNVADYTNAYIGEYKLNSMGAVASNGRSSANIRCVYLMELEADSAVFACRITNIPEGHHNTEITFTPYYEIVIDGVATTIYGETVTSSYSAALN